MDKRIHFFCLVAIDAVAIAATVLQIQYLSILCSALAGILILMGSPMQSFYTILGTCLMSGVFGISTFGMYFILMLIAYIKIDGHLLQVDKYGPFVIFLLLIYIVHEMQYTTIGWIVYYSTYLLYLFKVLSVFDWSDYDHRYATIVFLMSIIFCQVGSALLTGDLTMLSDENAMNVRFGEGDVENGMNNNLGGAMSFPINTLMFITLSLPIIVGQWAQKKWKVLLVILIVALFVITFFTTSRVYLLGLATFGVMLIFSLWSRETGAWSKVLSLLVIGGCIFVFFRIGISGLIESRYAYRNSIDYGATSSRYIIAQDCLSYLSSHPLAAIFGKGYKSYSTIGQQLNLAFGGMTAHNIVLDCIMAFGLFGFILILSASRKFYVNLKNNTDCFGASVIGFMPLVCWFVMSLTNSGFMNPKTYVMIPFLIMHSVYHYQLQTNE